MKAIKRALSGIIAAALLMTSICFSSIVDAVGSSLTLSIGSLECVFGQTVKVPLTTNISASIETFQATVSIGEGAEITAFTSESSMSVTFNLNGNTPEDDDYFLMLMDIGGVAPDTVIGYFEVKIDSYSPEYTISMSDAMAFDTLYMPVDLAVTSGTITVKEPSPQLYLGDIIAPSTTMPGKVNIYAKDCFEIQQLMLTLSVELVPDDTSFIWKGLTASTTYSDVSVLANDTSISITAGASFTPDKDTPIATIIIPKAPCRSGHFSMHVGIMNVGLSEFTFDSATTDTNLNKQIDIADRDPYLGVLQATAYAGEICEVQVTANNFAGVKRISFSFDPDMMSVKNATAVDASYSANLSVNADGTAAIEYFRTDNQPFTIDGEVPIIKLSLQAPLDATPYEVDFVSCQAGTYIDANDDTINIETLEGNTIDFDCNQLSVYSPPISAEPGATVDVPLYFVGLEESDTILTGYQFNVILSEGLSITSFVKVPNVAGSDMNTLYNMNTGLIMGYTTMRNLASNCMMGTFKVKVADDADLSQPLSIRYEDPVLSNHDFQDVLCLTYPTEILGYGQSLYVMPIGIEAGETHELPVYANIAKIDYDSAATVRMQTSDFLGCSSVDGIELNAYGKKYFKPTSTPGEYTIPGNINIPTEGIVGAKIGSIRVSFDDYDTIMALDNQNPSFSIGISYDDGAVYHSSKTNDFVLDMLNCSATLSFDASVFSVTVNGVSVNNQHQLVGLPGDEFTLQATLLNTRLSSFRKWVATLSDSSTTTLASAASCKYSLNSGDIVSPTAFITVPYQYDITTTNGTCDFTDYYKATTKGITELSGELLGSDIVTLTGNTADDGYEFDAWYINGTLYSNQQTINYLVTEAVAIECRYKAKQYSLKLCLINGMINGSVDDVTDTIVFNEAFVLTDPVKAQFDLYKFDGWYTENGTQISSEPTLDYTVTEVPTLNADNELVFYARFSPKSDALSVEVGGEDTVKVFNPNSEEILSYNTIGSGSGLYPSNNIDGSLSGTFTITCDNTNNNFAYWLLNGAYAGSETSLTFEFGSAVSIEAVYCESFSATVSFFGFGNQLVDTVTVNSGATAVEMPTTSTTKLGWDFSGWSMTEQQILDAVENGDDDIIVHAVYTQKTDTVIVSFGDDIFLTDTDEPTLGEKPESIVCEIGDLVTLTADEDKYTASGYAFVGWVVSDGAEATEYDVISFKTTFQFYAKSDVTISALYRSSVIIETAKAVTNIVSSSYDNGKYSVSVYAEVGDGYTILAAGIMAVQDNAVYEDGYDYDSLVSSNADYCRYGGLGKNAYQFTWTKNITETTTWYVRGFVTVRNNETGIISTQYTSVCLMQDVSV